MIKKLFADNITKLVKGANELKIAKDEIISIMNVSNGYVLIYFDYGREGERVD